MRNLILLVKLFGVWILRRRFTCENIGSLNSCCYAGGRAVANVTVCYPLLVEYAGKSATRNQQRETTAIILAVAALF